MFKLATASLALSAGVALAKPLNRRAVLADCLAEKEPIAIAVPLTQEHIQDAIRCGAETGVKVTPKCGGHSYANFGFGGEDGHLVLELDRMNAVKLDKKTGIASVQGGSRLGHVAYELYEQGKRGISHGTCPGVGSGGHVLHGGYGVSSHTKGLALDWLVEATVVLANATAVTCSETENSDLFWAVRGAGSSYGVVSEFKFKTFEVPEVITRFNAILRWNANNSVAGLSALQEWAAEDMPAEINARVFLNPQIPNLEGLYYGTKEELTAVLDPLLVKVNGMLQDATETDWPGQLSHFGGGLDLDQSHPYKSIYTDALTDSQLNALVDYWYTTAKKVRRGWYHHIDLHGGKTSAISAVDADSTSYVHRDKLLMHNFYDHVDVRSAYPEDGFDLFNGFIDAIVGDGDKNDYGVYFNYPDPNLDQETAQKRYWGSALPRLQEIKAAVDPDELFYLPQSVRPAKRAVEEEPVEEEPVKEEPVEEEPAEEEPVEEEPVEEEPAEETPVEEEPVEEEPVEEAPVEEVPEEEPVKEEPVEEEPVEEEPVKEEPVEEEPVEEEPAEEEPVKEEPIEEEPVEEEPVEEEPVEEEPVAEEEPVKEEPIEEEPAEEPVEEEPVEEEPVEEIPEEPVKEEPVEEVPEEEEPVEVEPIEEELEDCEA
ncbi:unnamed protein product [Parascedosporium putredinis]|uniref:FAD-binding PCMH-type domain-containing protein n=1 Tax=Parascedosporium putredinis TaxID=1442378 RepID=A0A9P1GZX1_9PEZI|nr:unnamed protein product [Parascedosporium putredinis]CAI7991216.1 unnamed protein product [Parascedosporium putredinis]